MLVLLFKALPEYVLRLAHRNVRGEVQLANLEIQNVVQLLDVLLIVSEYVYGLREGHNHRLIRRLRRLFQSGHGGVDLFGQEAGEPRKQCHSRTLVPVSIQSVHKQAEFGLDHERAVLFLRIVVDALEEVDRGLLLPQGRHYHLGKDPIQMLHQHLLGHGLRPDRLGLVLVHEADDFHHYFGQLAQLQVHGVLCDFAEAATQTQLLLFFVTFATSHAL